MMPLPPRALLAICSDLDETPDAETYFELMRFLNTTGETSMGTGVGLEVGNTLYFDMAPGQFSYWNTTEPHREKIRALIRSGHIDCLHSFGDLATTRAHAARALEELQKHDCRIRVWIDHAQAITNFGADIMQGQGDQPGHPAYHADLTMAYGIEYVWRGRVTSVIGQDRPFSLRGIAEAGHPLASAKTLATEAAKQILGCCGTGNTAFMPATGRSGPEPCGTGSRSRNSSGAILLGAGSAWETAGMKSSRSSLRSFWTVWWNDALPAFFTPT